MYFALIDSKSEISELTTVAYGVNISDIAEWFVDEFEETLEMYADYDELQQDESVLEQSRQIRELARENALDMSDVDGLYFSFDDISVELYGIYDGFEEFSKAFCEFVSQKPKYVKIVPDTNTDDYIKECDRLNTLLVRASI